MDTFYTKRRIVTENHINSIRYRMYSLNEGVPAIVYTTVVWVQLQAYVRDVVIIVLDVLTFLIPPVLPAVMTSINAHAQRRLRKQSVYCLNSRYINLCGGLDVICFDKTGTLTEDGLSISGVIPVQDGQFQTTVKDLTQLPLSALTIAMATCHSLTIVNGELLGDTLDVKMFESLAWELKEPEAESLDLFEKTPARIVYPKCSSNEKEKRYVGIIRQFPFESLLQRMTVVTKDTCSNSFEVCIKGAPEIIASLSLKTTVPENFKELLESYTRQGFRVLAIGWKSLNSSVSWNDALQTPREDLECDFHFLGLLVLQNHLKPESLPAVVTLKNADIRTVMVTGDNLLTAITVARECGMIDEADSVISVEAQLVSTNNSLPDLKVCYAYSKLPGYSENLNVGQNGMIEEMFLPFLNEEKYHFAMEGTTFNLIRNHNEELLHKIVQKGTIFARMLPEQKLQLIDALQKIDHQVGMCGDGANDCGALKAAHAGVSLSVAEASVASPFTSKIENIECIPKLIREGRATLTATFGACRYMVCYCFVLLSAVLTMFWDGQKPSDGAYVMIDIVMNLLPPIVFGGTEPYHTIAKIPPTRTILSFLPQFSIVSFIALQTGVNVFTHYYCISQPWYEPFKYNYTTTHHPEPSHLGTTIITVNMMSYVIAAVIFASGPPYRQPFFTNRIYTAVVVFEFCLASYLTIYPAMFMMRYLNFKRAPYIDYHLILYGICLGNFVISYIWEVYFVQGFLFHHVVPVIKRMRGPTHQFEKIDKQISLNRSWPPVGKHEIVRPLQTSEKSKSKVDEPIRRKSSQLQKRWSCHSGDICNSLVVGLRLSTSEYKDARSEPLTFATFQDGSYSHVVQNERNKQTLPAQVSFV